MQKLNNGVENSIDQAEIWVVIPAAGVGKRMQADRPKQYLPLLGKTVLEHSLDCFLYQPKITGIIIALSQDDPYWKTLSISKQKPIYTVEGGSERSDSVLNALNYLNDHLDTRNNHWVMVHDAARPCLSSEDIELLLSESMRDSVGGILAAPVKDTMKRAYAENSKSQRIAQTESREHLYHALTPQMFPLATLRSALQSALDKQIAITDDASAMEYQGLSPRLIMGNANNIKITHPSDLPLAEFFLSNKDKT